MDSHRTSWKFQLSFRNTLNRLLYRNATSSRFTIVYIGLKVAHVVHLTTELYVLQAFLGVTTPLWGFHVFRGMMTGKPRTVFPKTVYCEMSDSD
ncbi:hypothetical protein QR680_011419 [Steinernema hermaphroditum]|uniref:Uncharacterized protein n=1 Tax=Steinernema hermaphroditum TaxID=289476 RepID=A0AA39LYN4_9BILA|nr:hypothetical protein QR680_011419 [Steinernema hermaphroditum]